MCSKIKSDSIPWEYIERMQILEKENQRLMLSQGQMVQETNRKCEYYLHEIQKLRDENIKLKKQNTEMKDLCYFMDDDRQQTKKLCKEWQEFGRYTSSVMKKEIESYHKKVEELEKQQEELMKENEELKNLCETWNQVALARDSGDGSSDPESVQLSKTMNLKKYNECNTNCNYINSEKHRTSFFPSSIQGRIRRTCSENLNQVESDCPSSSSSRPSQCELLDYIKGLEVRVQQLEQDRLTLSTSAPNLTTFHSPPSEKFSKYGSNKSLLENETWLQNMDDEICVYVEEPDDNADINDDNESLLSPIVEETEADNSCDSSIGEEFIGLGVTEHSHESRENSPSKRQTVEPYINGCKSQSDKNSSDKVVPCARIKAISWKYLEPGSSRISIDRSDSHAV